MKLVEEIILPAVWGRRRAFNLPNAPALLLLDGATQHRCPAALDLLKASNVIVHFLVPHSSHLTQPLDCLFFKILKGELKKNRPNYTNLSKSSNRLVHGICSLSKSIGWYIGLRSWHCAGFLVSLENTVPTMIYDLSVILGKRTQSTEEIIIKPSDGKKKRTKLFFSMPPLKKARVAPEEENEEETVPKEIE